MKIRNIVFFIFYLLTTVAVAQNKKYILNGTIKDSETSEAIPGVTIFDVKSGLGTTSTSDGSFQLSLPGGEHQIQFRFIGYEAKEVQLALSKDQSIDMILNSSSTELDMVVVKATRQQKISDVPQMSKVNLPMEQINDIPSVFGEKDVIKVFQLMPGVQSSGEGSTDLFVRGGSGDQNLFILDDAPIYNGQHLGGMFSVFTADALQSADLYKGGFPAEYGGRLSSVMDMRMKEGDLEEYHGKVALGLISSSIMLQGPLQQNKSSFIFSARRSYADLILGQMMNDEETKTKFNFYDFNLKLSYHLNKNNKLTYSTYLGRDKFKQVTDKRSYELGVSIKEDGEAGIKWGNFTNTLKWTHFFSDNIISNTSVVYNKYHFDFFNAEDTRFDSENSGITETQFKGLNYKSSIEDYTVKYDVDFVVNSKNTFKIGVIGTKHMFYPKQIEIENRIDNRADIKSIKPSFNAIESGGYIQHLWLPTEKWRLQYGLRWSYFKNNGASYNNLEPRLNVAYKINDNLSVKGSYARMNQYLVRLQSPQVGMPTDLYVSANKNIKPQQSDQIAIGIAKDITKFKGLSLSIEGYYKVLNDVVQMKNGESPLDIDLDNYSGDFNQTEWDKTVTTGKGNSYGVEFMVQKKIGKISGWVGYTLSWAYLDFKELNNGKKFMAPWDRRHDFTLVTIYKPKKTRTFSSVFTYGTGSPYTLPVGMANTNGFSPAMDHQDSKVDIYNSRSNFQGAAYHRLDLSAQFHKFKRKGRMRTWEVGIYNTYARNNVFYYNSKVENQRSILEKNGLFRMLPYVSYKFQF
ncbi:TonB-dependent receptor [Flammeovirga kamogawensis]|uniref:TonB-dependent receptor n=1 Tax=Flammeovirga kamogawensis TaxID=373891 RepID=A0ABX8GZL6_9BACT|nr:TonB-dependent receptor [Flammeovirga kamogawensis]MBB6458967.1 hypothetical protein [Flammeovirga kamogawensis]QWG08542.1 TonB-dependent receptor [Flammeovirga kamogawensis]TRX66833.1 TonB-dependent receptor [Flammeovirga kamogawensis]